MTGSFWHVSGYKDSASRAQKQTKFAVLPRRRLSKRRLVLRKVCKPRAEPNLFELRRGAARPNENMPFAKRTGRGIQFTRSPPPTAPVRSAAPPRPTIRIIRTTAADFLATVCDLFRLDNIRIQNPRKLSLQTKFIIQKENTCLTKRKYVYICDTIRTESGHPPENGHGFRLDKVRFRPNVKDRINATV